MIDFIFPIYPTKDQVHVLEQTLENQRILYNRAIAWHDRFNRTRINQWARTVTTVGQPLGMALHTLLRAGAARATAHRAGRDAPPALRRDWTHFGIENGCFQGTHVEGWSNLPGKLTVDTTYDLRGLSARIEFHRLIDNWTLHLLRTRG